MASVHPRMSVGLDHVSGAASGHVAGAGCRSNQRTMARRAASTALSRGPVNWPVRVVPLGEIVHCHWSRPGRARTVYSMPLYSIAPTAYRADGICGKTKVPCLVQYVIMCEMGREKFPEKYVVGAYTLRFPRDGRTSAEFIEGFLRGYTYRADPGQRKLRGVNCEIVQCQSKRRSRSRSKPRRSSARRSKPGCEHHAA